MDETRAIGGVTDADLQRRDAEQVGCARCGQVPVGQTGEYPCPVCGLPTLHDPHAPVEEVARDTAVTIAIIAVQREDGTAGVEVGWRAQIGGETCEGAFVGDPTNEDAEGMLVACWRAYMDARSRANPPASSAPDCG